MGFDEHTHCTHLILTSSMSFRFEKCVEFQSYGAPPNLSTMEKAVALKKQCFRLFAINIVVPVVQQSLVIGSEPVLRRRESFVGVVANFERLRCNEPDEKVVR